MPTLKFFEKFFSFEGARPEKGLKFDKGLSSISSSVKCLNTSYFSEAFLLLRFENILVIFAVAKCHAQKAHSNSLFDV